MTVYEKIDKALQQHEKHGYYERSLDSIADYIDWAWRWRKITHEEMENAASRICELYEGEMKNVHLSNL